MQPARRTQGTNRFVAAGLVAFGLGMALFPLVSPRAICEQQGRRCETGLRALAGSLASIRHRAPPARCQLLWRSRRRSIACPRAGWLAGGRVWPGGGGGGGVKRAACSPTPPSPTTLPS